MIFDILKKSFNNLLIPDVMKIMFCCVVGYLFLWIGLTFAVMHYINQYAGVEGALAWAVHFLGDMIGTAIALFFLPLFYPILISFFVNPICEAIEEENYPHLPPPNPPFWPTFWQDALFSLKAVGLNLLCLPLYLIPLVGIAVYYGLNGYIMGKQFFWMAAGRRVTREEANVLLKRGRNLVFGAGALTMFCATLPLICLVAPVLMVAAMLHLFHKLNGTQQMTVIIIDKP